MSLRVEPVLRSPVVVGRRAELAEVRRLVSAARNGLLLVTGEAGIGKSRLLAEGVAAAADAGFVVADPAGGPRGRHLPGRHRALIGRLDSPAVTTSAAVRPYRPVLEQLAFPRHPAPRDTAAPDQAVVLGEGVLRMLRALAAEGTGCLLRLEGLHRADEDTLAVVEYLAGSAADAPVLVTVSVRPGAVADRLRAADGVRSLALRRLRPEDVAALAAACRAGDPDARALAIRSEGLPFVAEEMLAATLLEPDGPSLRWPHALTRDAVLAALLPPERAALAPRAADALVARGDPADEPRAAVLSIEAGRPERAARTLLD
ncbi:MAG: hypothetical protein QOJ30_2521, partial [Pseudonocardiales bacterium]|nr:hypothetical protein [Pseudonocardiales bacterium]